MKLKEIKPIHIQRFVNAVEERETHLDGTDGKLTQTEKEYNKTGYTFHNRSV